MIPEVGGIYPQRDVNVCTACHGDPSPVVVETFVSGQQMSLPWSRWKKSQGIATDIRIHPLGLWVSRQNVTAIHPIVIDTAAGTWRTDRTTERPHPVNIVSFLNKLQHLKLYAFIHHIFMPFFISILLYLTPGAKPPGREPPPTERQTLGDHQIHSDGGSAEPCSWSALVNPRSSGIFRLLQPRVKDVTGRVRNGCTE